MSPAQLTTLTSTAAPLGRTNVDTDQIIPARFLKGTVKTGLGRALFADWRYLPNGDPDPGFVLNNPRYTGASLLIAGDNFGCGSSREHAPWALVDAGFRAILAPSFADIFRNNALKNGLLPIILPEPEIQALMARVEAEPGLRFHVDLAAQTVQWEGSDPYRFDIDPYRKTCLLDGLDDIGYSLSLEAQISAYEARRDLAPLGI